MSELVFGGFPKGHPLMLPSCRFLSSSDFICSSAASRKNTSGLSKAGMSFRLPLDPAPPYLKQATGKNSSCEQYPCCACFRSNIRRIEVDLTRSAGLSNLRCKGSSFESRQALPALVNMGMGQNDHQEWDRRFESFPFTRAPHVGVTRFLTQAACLRKHRLDASLDSQHVPEPPGRWIVKARGRVSF